MGAPGFDHQHGQDARTGSADLLSRCARPHRQRQHEGECGGGVAAVALESGMGSAGVRVSVTRQRARRVGLAEPAMSLKHLDVRLRTLEPPARVDGAAMLNGLS